MDEVSLKIQMLEAELARLRNELKELQSARALDDPDHLLRTLMEQTPDQVYFKDRQGRFLRASRAVAEAFRWRDPADLAGKSDFDFFSQEHARRVYEDEQEIIHTGVPKVDMEEMQTWPDGSTTWVSTTKAPFRDAEGNILGTFGISRNITTRKQTEIALRISEEKLQMVFDHAVDGILMGSPEGLIVAANANACALTGWPKEELLGLHISRIFSEGSLTKLPLRFDLLKEGHRVISERDLFRRDGSLLPIEMHTKMMPDGTYQAIVRDISERKHAEKALRKSEQHFRELLDRLQEGFAFNNMDDRFVFANPAASAIFGVPEGLTGRQLMDFLAPESFEIVQQQNEHRKRGEKGQYELTIQRPDGENRVISLSVSPWLSEEGEFLGSTGLFQDVTERKQAEQALRESETNFRSLLEKLGEGFAVIDAGERWTYANPAAARIFGVKPEQLMGHSLREFLDEGTYQEVLRQTARRQAGESSTYEIEIQRPDGEKRFVSLSASPYLGENGEYLGADGLFLDVTERRSAENALRESQERYQQLFTNTTDAIFWFRLEANGTFVAESFNPAGEARLGKTSRELAERPLHAIFPKALADALEARYRRCVETGHPIRYEETIDLNPGSRSFQTLLVPIRDGVGRITRIVGFSQDITQNKEAEEALRQTQKLESLGVLAGGIAHDFNNLLTAMLGNLNLAQIKISPESAALPHLENVERIVLKASELTKQMLAYSGKGRFVVKPHDLNQVVQEMTHLLNVSISKKVLLRYSMSADLPAIEADAAQIQQVVMNLVTNASEAIGDREGVIGISTRQLFLQESQLQSGFAGQNLKSGSYAILEVTDSGSGINPRIQGKIFDPFFTTKQSGHGLGLSAMLGILRGHQAGIQIVSEVGKGSTFTLFFPAAAGVRVQKEARPSQSPARFLGRVLLVDDEADVREATTAMLEALGLEVVTAVDGQDALERFSLERGAINLVLLDLTMPRMDGREAFQELRRLQADIPVILYSGYSEHGSLRETLAQGFAGFLQKPFQMAELRAALRQALPKS